MKALKNSIAGFLVSFIGSLPVGYLNIIGYDTYKHYGAYGLVAYLLGVVAIEAFVVYFSLIIARKLTNSTTLLKILELLSIFFLLLLAFYFFAGNSMEHEGYATSYVRFSPFITGVVLSCLNFAQLPFWTGWSIYLINGSYISVKGRLRFAYIFFSMVGTCCGMALFVYFLNRLSVNAGALHFIMGYGISLVFVLLAAYNAWLFYKKYYRPQSKKIYG